MIKITMPQAGNTMEDGTVLRWHKAEGEAVRTGEVLLEMETDKATIELESAAAGTLRKILVGEGQTVPVHSVIALIGEAGEDVAAPLAEAQRENARLAAQAAAGIPAAGAPAPAAQTAPSPAQRPERPASPASAPAGPAAAGARKPAPPAGAVTPILMPQAGNSMEEGTIIKWHVRPGDRVKPGAVIFEVETDKATIEVEATESGRLSRIVVDEGQTMAVKQPVAYLAENDADVDALIASQGGAGVSQASADQAPAAAQSAVAVAAPAAAGAVASEGRAPASPAARKMAAQRGVDLGALGAGSGPGGRVLSSDVLTAPAGGRPAAAAPGQAVRRRMSGMRKAIARNLLASKQSIPHFYMRATIDAGPMQDFYRAEKAKYPCTLNDVIFLACARAIAEFPAFRSRLDKDELIEFPTANIGIAVGLEGGLVVPVVMAAERMDLRQAGAETKRIVEAARGGKIENMGQGVFTITNLGMFGIEEFTAIINPPEAAILAVGALREDVIVSGGAMRPGRVMTLTLSADHRVIDGLLAAKFLQRLKETLQQPAQLA